MSKENQQPESLKTYGFKSRNNPPQITLLEEFEKDLHGIVTSIKYRNVNSNFQGKLKSDISKIRSSANMFIFPHETNNIYEMKPQDHEKLIMENITKTYQKVTEKLEKAVNMEVKNITKSYKPAERIDHLPPSWHAVLVLVVFWSRRRITLSQRCVLDVGTTTKN